MKYIVIALSLVSTVALADAGSICEQNPDAPLCRPFPPGTEPAPAPYRRFPVRHHHHVPARHHHHHR